MGRRPMTSEEWRRSRAELEARFQQINRLWDGVQFLPRGLCPRQNDPPVLDHTQNEPTDLT